MYDSDASNLFYLVSCLKNILSFCCISVFLLYFFSQAFPFIRCMYVAPGIQENFKYTLSQSFDNATEQQSKIL